MIEPIGILLLDDSNDEDVGILLGDEHDDVGEAAACCGCAPGYAPGGRCGRY